jgi:hypothetical protein
VAACTLSLPARKAVATRAQKLLSMRAKALRRSQRESAFWRIHIVSGLLDVTVVNRSSSPGHSSQHPKQEMIARLPGARPPAQLIPSLDSHFSLCSDIWEDRGQHPDILRVIEND